MRLLGIYERIWQARLLRPSSAIRMNSAIIPGCQEQGKLISGAACEMFPAISTNLPELIYRLPD